MVRPSNPKLMAKVLDAVAHLGESKGSSVRDILQIVKKSSNGPNRNLVMQVQRALKHAVTAGILRHRNGRYQNAIALARISQLPKRRNEDDYNVKVVDNMPVDEESVRVSVDPDGTVHERGRRGRKRRGSRSRKGSRRRRKGSRRRGRRRGNIEEYQEIAPDNKKAKITEENKIQKRNSDKYSDISGSKHESRHRNRKTKPDNASRRSSSRQERLERQEQRKDVGDKSNRRSQSRNRSQTRNEPSNGEENKNAMECDDEPGQYPDNCEPKNCGSDSSLN